jgi:hypothetical protein
MDDLLKGAKDLLRLAELSEADAQAELFDAGDDGTTTLKVDAWTILARRIQDRAKREREDQYKRGIKTRSHQVEEAAKSIFEKYGVQSDDVLSGLSDLATKIDLQAKEKPSLADLNDEEVVRLPQFQRRLNAELAAARAEREALQKQHADYQLAIEQEKKDSIALGLTEQALVKAQAAFGANRSAQLKHFFKGLEKEYFHISEDGKTIDLLDKDGIAIRGSNKEMLTFDEYILNKWKDLGYATNDAPPASPAPGKSGSPGNFTTSAAVQEAIKTTKDPILKAELLKQLATLTRAGK